MAMKLTDVFAKVADGKASEKTAAPAGADEVDVLIASLGLKDQVKTAEDREVVKLGASYLEMGREIARQTFAAEVLKTADEAPAKTETEKKADAAATEKISGDAAVEALMVQCGLSEKPATEKVASGTESAEADLKENALRELVAGTLVPSAKTGNAKATAALKKIASTPKGKEMITEAVKTGAAMAEKSKGSLAKFLAAKKGKVEKK